MDTNSLPFKGWPNALDKRSVRDERNKNSRRENITSTQIADVAKLFTISASVHNVVI